MYNSVLSLNIQLNHTKEDGSDITPQMAREAFLHALHSRTDDEILEGNLDDTINETLPTAPPLPCSPFRYIALSETEDSKPHIGNVRLRENPEETIEAVKKALTDHFGLCVESISIDTSKLSPLEIFIFTAILKEKGKVTIKLDPTCIY